MESIRFEIQLRRAIVDFNKEAERLFKEFAKVYPPRCFLTHWYYYQLTRPTGLVSDVADVFIRDITSTRAKELLKELTIIAMRKNANEEIALQITDSILILAKRYLQIRKDGKELTRPTGLVSDVACRKELTRPTGLVSDVACRKELTRPKRYNQSALFRFTHFEDESNLALLENRSICYTSGATTEKVRITKALERKLRMMYAANNEQFDENEFLIRVFCMLYRYETLNMIAKETMQLSAPDNDYAQKEKDGYTLECFASPINSHLERFCSGFYDVDKYFGSLGSFFEVGPTVLKDCSIKATCDTPYQLDAIELNVDIVLEALKQEEYEKEFHFILPYWSDAEYVKKLKDSKYTKSYIVDEAYTYVLHSTENENKKSIVPCATLRCLLRNFE